MTLIDFYFGGIDQLIDFLDLLERNTNNSLVSLPSKYPPILTITMSYEITSGQIKNYGGSVYHHFLVANCFKDDIIGLSVDASGILNEDSLSLLPNLKYLRAAPRGRAALYRFGGNLSSLKDSTKLEYLDLEAEGFVGDLNSLKNLTNLKYLELAGGTGFNNRILGDLSSLKDLTKLEYLGLGNTGVTGSLSDLSSLPQLRDLYLQNTGVTGSLSDLSSLPQLRKLYLCPNENIRGDVADVPTIKATYKDGYTDLGKCLGVTGVIHDIDCSDERYNCMCGDNSVTCDN